eukprot:15463804-Alexandrium_andersonii.AAC.1
MCSPAAVVRCVGVVQLISRPPLWISGVSGFQDARRSSRSPRMAPSSFETFAVLPVPPSGLAGFSRAVGGWAVGAAATGCSSPPGPQSPHYSGRVRSSS